MDCIGKSLPAMTLSPQSTAVSTRSSARRLQPERLRAAKEALQSLMKGRPDTNAENPKYLADMVEVLAHLTDEERAWLTHPRDGLHTVCKFLPTPADVHGFLRDRKVRLDAVRPAATTYRKLGTDDSDAPWNRETDFERKKRVVRETLGYDPDEQGATPAKQVLAPATAADVANRKLETAPVPPSSFLLAKLEAEGWPSLPVKAHD
jgi:hypothetical protein